MNIAESIFSAKSDFHRDDDDDNRWKTILFFCSDAGRLAGSFFSLTVIILALFLIGACSFAVFIRFPMQITFKFHTCIHRESSIYFVFTFF